MAESFRCPSPVVVLESEIISGLLRPQEPRGAFVKAVYLLADPDFSDLKSFLDPLEDGEYLWNRMNVVVGVDMAQVDAEGI